MNKNLMFLNLVFFIGLKSEDFNFSEICINNYRNRFSDYYKNKNKDFPEEKFEKICGDKTYAVLEKDKNFNPKKTITFIKKIIQADNKKVIKNIQNFSLLFSLIFKVTNKSTENINKFIIDERLENEIDEDIFYMNILKFIFINLNSSYKDFFINYKKENNEKNINYIKNLIKKDCKDILNLSDKKAEKRAEKLTLFIFSSMDNIYDIYENKCSEGYKNTVERIFKEINLGINKLENDIAFSKSINMKNNSNDENNFLDNSNN